VRVASYPHTTSAARWGWIIGGILCFLRRPAGAVLIAGMAWGGLIFESYFNHLLFIAWVATTLALFREVGQMGFVVRSQLTILYGYAAVSKISMLWLSGAALAMRGVEVPTAFLLLLVWGALLSEGMLAVGLWLGRARRVVLLMASGMHVGFLVVMAQGPLWREWGLLPFNALALGLLWWATHPDIVAGVGDVEDQTLRGGALKPASG
jgi:hypothetical protein